MIAFLTTPSAIGNPDGPDVHNVVAVPGFCQQFTHRIGMPSLQMQDHHVPLDPFLAPEPPGLRDHVVHHCQLITLSSRANRLVLVNSASEKGLALLSTFLLNQSRAHHGAIRWLPQRLKQCLLGYSRADSPFFFKSRWARNCQSLKRPISWLLVRKCIVP